MVRLADFAKYKPEVRPTFPPVAQVLAVVQYWLADIDSVPDVYDAARFESDPVYARHIGQLNVFTLLIRHRDSNQGNFLIGKSSRGARVFSVDHGVAFASDASDRGELWKSMRVRRLPADTVERLRAITPELLAERLGVLAQWRLENGAYVRVPNGPNVGPNSGVRRKGDDLQMGLTKLEISSIQRLLAGLLKRVDAGEFTLVASAPVAP